MSPPIALSFLVTAFFAIIYESNSEHLPWKNEKLLQHAQKLSTFENEAVITESLPWPILDTTEHRANLRNKRSSRRRSRRTFAPPAPIYIKDCVQVIANPGTYVVHSREGSNDPCGVYIAGLHNELIEVEISLVDVSCETGGLVAFFDGWEMNGYIFPAESDHEHHLTDRVVSLCKENFPKRRDLRLRSKQNVALLQYRIPRAGEGFVFRVTMKLNRDPCNVLVTEDKSLFTLTNSGMARNCSLTAVLTPPNLKLIQFEIGKPTSYVGLSSRCSREDYVDIGGSSNLDPSLMDVKETFCGKEPEPAKMGLTILCDSSSVRLVSSGNYDNSVTVAIEEAVEEDMDYENNVIMVCPDYNA